MLGGIAISFIAEISKESDIDSSDPESIITINKDTLTNSGFIVNGNGDTLYLKRGDSVLVNEIGTDTIEQDDYR